MGENVEDYFEGKERPRPLALVQSIMCSHIYKQEWYSLTETHKSMSGGFLDSFRAVTGTRKRTCGGPSGMASDCATLRQPASGLGLASVPSNLCLLYALC